MSDNTKCKLCGRVIPNKISFTTNLCFILNMWFQESKNPMWKEVYEWLRAQREIGLQDNTPDFIEVTFKLSKNPQVNNDTYTKT